MTNDQDKAEPTRYAFSDAEMLDIFRMIDQKGNPPFVVMVTTILTVYELIFRQDGSSFEEQSRKGPFNSDGFAIPQDQYQQIIDRMRTRLLRDGVDPLTITNTITDYINRAPLYY